MEVNCYLGFVCNQSSLEIPLEGRDYCIVIVIEFWVTRLRMFWIIQCMRSPGIKVFLRNNFMDCVSKVFWFHIFFLPWIQGCAQRSAPLCKSYFPSLSAPLLKQYFYTCQLARLACCSSDKANVSTQGILLFLLVSLHSLGRDASWMLLPVPATPIRCNISCHKKWLQRILLCFTCSEFWMTYIPFTQLSKKRLP